MQHTSIPQPASPPGNLVRFGAFELDTHTLELRKDGIRVRLDGQPLQLLKLLVERPGDLFTREELKQRLWAADTFVDFEHGINAAVKRLRQALDDSAETPQFVETLPRRGYRFICPLSQTRPHHAPPTRRLVPIRFGVIFATAAFLAIAAIYIYVRHATTNGAPRISSIVVLPLNNVSGDSSQDYLAEGMTDELTTTIAEIRGIRVMSRTSAMQYKNTKKSLPAIARELNVDGVIEGTMLRSLNRVRITVQLIHAPSDTHVWAQTYERDFQDLIGLQDEVAVVVARQVKVAVAPGEEKQLSARRSIQPRAYELYLKGRHYFGNRMMEKAAESFSDAIKIEPDYPEAYAGLGDSLIFYSMSNAALPSEATPRGRNAALQALRMDDNVAEAHASLGWAKMDYDWDWAGAEAEFRRAVALNPSYETAHLWYGCELVWEKRFDEGLAEMKLAQEVAPTEPWIAAFYGMGLYQARRYDEAVRQLRDALDLDRTLPAAHQWLGLTYSAQGLNQEAVAELELAVHYAKDRKLRESAANSRLGYVYAVAGHNKDAAAMLEELRKLSATSYVPAIHFAVIYIGLGDKDRAFAWLEKAYEERSFEIVLIGVDPRFDSLRSDTRFRDLSRRLNFPN